jgi:hypothetical protein
LPNRILINKPASGMKTTNGTKLKYVGPDAAASLRNMDQLSRPAIFVSFVITY